jgi:hypothetical protein
VTFNSNGLTAPARRTGRFCIASNDPSKPLVEVPLTLNVIYNFNGFFGTVKNPPQVNRIKAGSTVPVTFSLSGNQGMDIFASGSPSSHQIDCDTQSPLDEAEPALAAGNGLSYDPVTDRYTYRWKTQADWLAGTCRELTVTLDDATTHRALLRIE